MAPNPQTGLRWVVVVSACAVATATFLRLRSAESRRPEPGPPTFSRDVAPVMFAKCASCHHPGEAAPFSLLTYDDARRRARQIADVTAKRFMPPWLPRAGCGDFAGDRRLTEDEVAMFQRWAADGAPRGDDGDTPSAPTFADGWQAGSPDLVLETPAYSLASQDRDVFRNFVVPVHIDGPKWVRSIELRPENPRVTHHARLGVDASNESVRREAQEKEPGYPGMAWGQDPDGQLVMWAPGLIANPGEPDVAWRLYPHTCLVLHTHLQPSGKPEVVKFRVGIRFADRPPDVHPALLRVGTCDIDIPAGAARHTVTDEYVLPVDVDVHTILPHAHSLCRELAVTAERPDGSSAPLIAIDRFDENWHDCYRYREPVRLPRGTKVRSTFTYDNSDDNPRNRHRPARRVVYGSNADDEMADVYLQVTAVRPDQRAVLMEHYKRYDLRAQLVGHERSLAGDPDNPWSQEALAASYVGLGEPARAVAILERRVKTGPPAVFPVASLGLALLAAGDAAKAEERLRQAVAIDGDYALAWHGLGKALAARKKPDDAVTAFRRAADMSAGLWEARLGVADALIQRNELDRAREVCTEAAAASPDVAAIHLKLAEIAAKQRNWDESLAHCETARRLAPYTHPPRVLLAVYCFANGEPDRGLRLLQQARAESPAHPMPPLMLGQLARRQRQLALAREFLSFAAALPVPDNWPDSHRRRFLVLLHSERFQLAQQLPDAGLARDALAAWSKAEPENERVRKMYEDMVAGR